MNASRIQQFDQITGLTSPKDATGTQSKIRANELRAKYGVAAQPKQEAKPSFLQSVLKGETSFPATEGGVESLPVNLAKTAGNIPSSTVKLVKAVASPVNPFDIDSPINIGKNIAEGAGALKEISDLQSPIEGVKSILGGFADTYLKIGESIYGGVEKAYNALLDDPKKAVTDATNYIAKIGIEDPMLIPSLLYGGGKIKGAKDPISTFASPITRGADTSFDGIVKALTTKSEEQIESIILKKFEKGVKPGINAKMTPTKLADYRDDVVSAVKTINENKANLSFVDETGEVIAGQSPKSLQQLSDAVEQTKKSIFSKYDALAKEAGEAGIAVDTSVVVKELDSVINNKALALSNPGAVRYAEAAKLRYEQAGKLDVVTAQEVIQNYNVSLKAFYARPSYETATTAGIDAMIANNVRKVLDDSVTGLTGESYQALKNQYGALTAIEKDVVKAALRDARKNTKGLIDLTDIFTGGQFVSGILTMNPTLIASSVTQKSIATFYKYLNNPNRAIEKMFGAVDELPVGVPGAVTPSKPKINMNSGFIKNPFVKSEVKLPEANPTRGTSLAQEASKYKNAEEFMESLNINYENSGWKGPKNPNADRLKSSFEGKVFHGTNSVDDILTNGYKKGEYFNSGAYFSDTPDRSIGYMKQNRGAGKGSDVLINDLGNLKIKQGEGEIVRAISKNNTGMEDFVTKLKKQGYDGIKDEYGETLVWNVEKIKKPERLTDIWYKNVGMKNPLLKNDVPSLKKFKLN